MDHKTTFANLKAIRRVDTKFYWYFFCCRTSWAATAGPGRSPSR